MLKSSHKLLLAVIMLCSLHSSCNSKSKKNQTSNIEIQNLEIPPNDSVLVVNWLEKSHTSIREPKLIDLDFECYRFNYIDSYGNHELYRLNHYSSNNIELIRKTYKETEKSFVLKSENTIEVSPKQYEEFKSLINGSYFWSLKLFHNSRKKYMDGYVYVLEGYKPNIEDTFEYYIVSREIPEKGSFKQACDKLKSLSNEVD
jgi:hypothetical protein